MDWTDVIVKVLIAAGGLATGLGGLALSKRGQQDTREQQVAANELQRRVNTVDELETVIGLMKEARDRAEEERDKLAARLEAEREKKDAATTVELERQAMRCQVQIDRLVDNVATLQSIIQDEIARESALDNVKAAQQHQQDDHGRTWGDEPGGAVRY